MITVFDFSGNAYPVSDYSNFHITHKQDGNDVMSFRLDVSHEQYSLMREEAIVRTDENEYLIKKIDDDRIDCTLNFDFLKAEMHLNYKSETRTLLAVLLDCLPSGWTIEGGNVTSIQRTIEFDGCTDYDIVQQCMKTYGVKFIWHILNKRLVVVKPELMNSTGEYITSELNLQDVEFQGESTSFATVLYAFGKDGMTMEDAIVDGSRYGYKYVENTSYLNKQIYAYWKDERYTVPENLYAAAVEKLAKMAWPVRSYTCKVVDLAKQDASYSFLTFSMFKKVTLLDIDRGIAVEHQIVEYDEWPDEEAQNTVTLNCVQDTIYTRIDEALENGGQASAEEVRQELEDFINGQYADDIASLEGQIDGKGQTYSQNSEPATNWTADEKAEHVGDLWYNTSTQKYYRYSVSGNTYSWTEITATPPSSVVSTINSKAQIFTSQPTPPYYVGDLWFNSTNDDIMTCVTERTTGSYTATDWAKRNKYTDDTTADQVRTDLTEAIEDAVEALEQADSEVTTALNDRLNMATAMLTSAFGSYFYVNNGELFMMDNTDPAQATVVWRWNVNGFAKSSTGIDGPYTTAITVDDSFLTGVVNATIIRGDLIEANSISAGKIQQTYTDGVLTQAYESAKGYVDALFTNLNTYLNGDDGQLTVIREDITDIEESIAGLNLDFTEAFRGGINYAHNSAGLNGLSDDWSTTGTVVTLQNSDTKNYTVSNSCFRLSTDAQLSQTIDNVVLGQPYTISAKVKKTGTLLSEVYVVYNGSSVGKLFSSSEQGYSWGDYSFTIDSIQSTSIQIICTTRSDYLFVSDIMVCEGVTSKAWTPAPDEIYTSGVRIDKRGIVVYRSGSSERTVITNEEFAGYNGQNRIFSLNGDETEIVNATVRQQLKIEDVMFIPFENGGEKGLNIALID